MLRYRFKLLEASPDLPVWREVQQLDFTLQPYAPLPQKLGELRGLVVYAVDGNKIKVKHHPDFVEGGNDRAYPDFVPKGEIWVDAHLDQSQWPFVIYHEFVERDLMVKGASYEDAHDQANAQEMELRRTLTKTEAVDDLSAAGIKALRLIADARGRSTGGRLQVGTKSAPIAVVKVLRGRGLIELTTETDKETKRGRTKTYTVVFARITDEGAAHLAALAEATSSGSVGTTTANVATYIKGFAPLIQRTPLKLKRRKKDRCGACDVVKTPDWMR